MQGGYHDAFTHNDNAIVKVIELLNKAAQGQGALGFLPRPLKGRPVQPPSGPMQGCWPLNW